MCPYSVMDETIPPDDEDWPDRLIEIAVPPGAEGERLDRLLAGSLPGRSRSFLKRLIEDGRLQRDMGGGLEPPHSCVRQLPQTDRPHE